MKTGILFLVTLFMIKTCYGWSEYAWNTGAKYLKTSNATFSYDSDEDAWVSNKPLITEGGDSTISGDGVNNLNIDANGQAITLGNAVSDYIEVDDSGHLTFAGDAHIIVNDDYPFSFGSSQDVKTQWDTQGVNDFMKIGIRTNSTSGSGHIVLCDLDDINNSNIRPSAVSDTPVFRVVGKNIDSDPNRFIQLYSTNYTSYLYSGNNLSLRSAGEKILIGNASGADILGLRYVDSENQTLFYTGGSVGRHLAFVDFTYRSRNFDHGVQTDPTLFIHSASDPDIDNTQWIGFFHNKTDAQIQSGKGDVVIEPASGSVTIKTVLKIMERSSDPAEPSEGECIIWMSDGTGYGDDGDICIASHAGGSTKKAILFDHSSGANW